MVCTRRSCLYHGTDAGGRSTCLCKNLWKSARIGTWASCLRLMHHSGNLLGCLFGSQVYGCGLVHRSMSSKSFFFWLMCSSPRWHQTGVRAFLRLLAHRVYWPCLQGRGKANLHSCRWVARTAAFKEPNGMWFRYTICVHTFLRVGHVPWSSPCSLGWCLEHTSVAS